MHVEKCRDMISHYDVIMHNVKVLHQYIVGHGFKAFHEFMDELYGVLDDQIDEIIERCATINIFRPTLAESLAKYPELEVKTRDLDESLDYARKHIGALITISLEEAKRALKVLDDEGYAVGDIISDFESYQGELRRNYWYWLNNWATDTVGVTQSSLKKINE